MTSTECGTDMLSDWLCNIQEENDEYKEPTLDKHTLNFLRLTARALKQDIRVFVSAVDILEEYICVKGETTISHPTLVAVSSVFIACKCVGDQDLKVQHLQSYLQKVTGIVYEYNQVVSCELDIFSTLRNSVPVSNKVDDLTTFVFKFEKDTRIRAQVMPVCLDIMEMLYLTKKMWFYRFKEIYAINEEACKVFGKLMRHRLFLPICILMFVFRNTNYQHCLDVEKILQDMSEKSKIHTDHINTFITLIGDVYCDKM
nr:unnamed protein product [Callosobruchus analis]CAI5820264.1 unnamed protein product [Callosobruchus analis]